MSSAASERAPSAPGALRQPLVVVRGLTKSFALPDGELRVLQNIDLELQRGELVSLVGQSGVGKSTFLQIVGTLDVPTSGSVLFEGEDVFAKDEAELAGFRNRSIGFIFQFHHLLPEFTALENAMMPALIARQPFAEARERALWLLDRVGLSERLDHRPSELSGGEQQRVAIARALAMSPKLVLADEPTGNLDQRTSDEIHGLMLELNAETEITFLVATHNFDLARQMKRHLVQRAGVIEELTAEEARAHHTRGTAEEPAR